MENSIQALERRTGKRRNPPDVFSITSLDVIIYEEKKLGSGGYGQVYLGDWLGTTVAVKVLEKGLPPSVRRLILHSVDRTADRTQGLGERD